MYKEVGRLRVNIVHEGTTTATVLRTCEAIAVGDICIPFNVKDEPLVKLGRALDPLAPPTGKVTGTIIAGRDFTWWFAQRDVAFLDIGSKQGVALGQYYRVFRPFNNTNEFSYKYTMQYPTYMMGEQMSPHLTLAEQNALPRDILGEMVIIHVEGKTATALVTTMRRPIRVGDNVELQ